MKKLFVLLAFIVIASTSYAQVYKMYKIQNSHNQLRSNTMTGESSTNSRCWSVLGNL